MVTKLEVSNFRNLNHIVLSFENKTSILTGANGIGKSNALNAENWLLTNTLLTDKWGTGENDLNSVFPKDYVKGQNPTVTITLDSGITFTKKFVKGKDGNSAEYYINGVKEKSKKNFEDSLFESLKFEKKLRCEKEVNELRLFTDPLYALQKLDAKQLRTLLVELGCSVSNEEVFELYPAFEPLKEHRAKYQDDYTKMRTALKAEKADLVKQYDSIPYLLDSLAADEFKPEDRVELEKEKQDLISRINTLKSDDAIKTLEKELEALEKEKEVYVKAEQSKIDVKLAVLEEKKKVAESNALSSQNEELKAINSQIQNKSELLISLNTSSKNYEATRNSCRNDATKARTEVDELVKKRNKLEEDLEQTTHRQFVGWVTCPDCGKMFAADEVALTLFNKQKQDDIANIEVQVSKIEISIKEQEKRFDEVCKLGLEAKEKQEEVDNQILALKEEIDTLNKQKSTIVLTPVDRSKVEEYENQIEELEYKEIPTQKYDSKIRDLKKKIEDAKNGGSDELKAEIEDLSSRLEKVEEEIKETYELETKENQRIQLIQKEDKLVAEISDKEHLIELVNSFIQTKIKLINNKAKDLTGLDFVMLEENITNDGVKEVCYATVDGVEFGNVNTSQKVAVGIKFIEKLKDILGHNNLPILADRLEGFDDIETIKGLTTEQLICTVVGNKNQKEIVII